ncbi:response regulator [Thauera linaloolentis]|uniref:Response regulator receiver protein n=1 Tax=Thauera linaloolentis (strain DSM 12138 / JCM 21573 / CCUG 41526 / CIP 105981 / IAM 15112 / NBRC 102519 / 47Lol) TaxID=1123367 RepID=N6YVC2_THAL4|nr:response regulator [Thauera linaloolentis]ENO86357.1 response regulator receiver protein [Thauera linaloolentis 47Lol = DSM 12138]MCM8565059.1 response regulator [Thauera linaloolentis]
MAASASRPLRVVLIEDSPILCAMLRDMLGELDGVEVVADADDEQGALAELEQHWADIAIVDLELRQGSGLGVLSRLQAEPERYGRPRAVVFSNHGHSTLRTRCGVLGVEHFFDKSFQMDELLEFIQAAASRH